ncbi:MAG TPA: kynureninase, partial [Flavobacteriia bacterium]|nr:kynureninase [Flavobacteriia bacterium]
MSHYKTGLDYAIQQDQHDTLAPYRKQFYIPKDNKGNDWLYFTGNSLGLQPKTTKAYLQQ